MGLRILTPPTCVGLRYGRIQSRARSFSWHLGLPTLAAIAFVLRFSLTSDGFAYLTAYTYSTTSIGGLGYPDASLHTQTIVSGSGILTGLPSTTPLGLALGTD